MFLSRFIMGRKRKLSSSSSSSSDSDSCSASDSSSGSSSSSSDDVSGSAAKLVFCSKHKDELKPDTCNVCLHMKRMLKPKVVKALVRKAADKKGDLPSKGERCFYY